jgi:hypothetical protein
MIKKAEIPSWMTPKDVMDQLFYPCFVVVFAPSVRPEIETEVDEYFKCDMCNNSNEAKALLEGYGGGPTSLLQIYVANGAPLRIW